jgi:CubicO group peptidase (beta-lactamase class C family)
MQPSDVHLILSVNKAFVGTVLGLLEDARKVDISKPIEAYLPEFAGTAWAGTSIRDISMASGMEGAEFRRSLPRSETPTVSNRSLAGLAHRHRRDAGSRGE